MVNLTLSESYVLQCVYVDVPPERHHATHGDDDEYNSIAVLIYGMLLKNRMQDNR